jgi:uridylate kinase
VPSKPAYKRILLKLSGEALMGKLNYGISPDVMTYLAGELKDVVAAGVQVAIVVGGGNIFRGEGLARAGMDRVTGDQMGMLATVINALAIQDTLERHGQAARVQSAIRINEVCEDFIRLKAIRHLEKGRVVVFAAGTGNPFFTTDSAAALRAIETGCDLLLKATKVDGIYTADPKKDPTATKYDEITFGEALQKQLKIADATAFALCMENKMPIVVYGAEDEGAVYRIVQGEKIGTLVTAG